MKNKVKRQIIMTFSVVFSVLLVVMLSGYSLVRGYISRIEYVEPGEGGNVSSRPQWDDEEEEEDDYPHLENLPDDVILMRDQDLYDYYHNDIEPISSSHVINILLVGNDTLVKG